MNLDSELWMRLERLKFFACLPNGEQIDFYHIAKALIDLKAEIEALQAEMQSKSTP